MGTDSHLQPQARCLVINWHKPNTAFNTKGAEHPLSQPEASAPWEGRETTRLLLVPRRLQLGPPASGQGPNHLHPGLCLAPGCRAWERATKRTATSL